MRTISTTIMYGKAIQTFSLIQKRISSISESNQADTNN